MFILIVFWSCRIELQYTPGSAMSHHSMLVERHSQAPLHPDSPSDELREQMLTVSQPAQGYNSFATEPSRAHAYHRVPRFQGTTSTRQAIYHVRKADERRVLWCCGTCNARRLYDVAPSAIKWRRSDDSGQGALTAL